jgi:hypothetical protein
MLKRLFASAVLVLLTGQANAQIYSGNELVDELREADKVHMGYARPDFLKVGFYYGFVAAAFDAYDSAGMLCGTEQVPLWQALAIVNRYFKAHPTKWHSPAVELIREALQSAFPCAK